MSGKFDITTYIKTILDIDKIIDIILNKGINIKIGTVRIYDNYEFQNEQIYTYPINLSKFIESYKLLLLDIHINKNLVGGISIYKYQEGQYEYCIWLDIDYYPNLEIEELTKENIKFYNMTTDFILNYIEPQNLEMAALGFETTVDYETIDKIEYTIRNNTGVVRWILPANKKESISPKILKKCIDICWF